MAIANVITLDSIERKALLHKTLIDENSAHISDLDREIVVLKARKRIAKERVQAHRVALNALEQLSQAVYDLESNLPHETANFYEYGLDSAYAKATAFLEYRSAERDIDRRFRTDPYGNHDNALDNLTYREKRYRTLFGL